MSKVDYDLTRKLRADRELTQAAPTPYDRAVAIESYLRAFPYTLEASEDKPGVIERASR